MTLLTKLWLLHRNSRKIFLRSLEIRAKFKNPAMRYYGLISFSHCVLVTKPFLATNSKSRSLHTAIFTLNASYKELFCNANPQRNNYGEENRECFAVYSNQSIMVLVYIATRKGQCDVAARIKE